MKFFVLKLHHRIEKSPAQAQKSHVKRQAQFVSRAVTGVNHSPFSSAESEKRLQLKGTEFARKVLQTQVGGVPALHRLSPSIGTPTIRGKEVA